MPKQFKMVDNYICFYHILDKNGNYTFMVLPTVPESLTDTLSVSFNQTNVLARSAPIFSYQYSGPRSIAITLSLHRDMMYDLNEGFSNVNVEIGDDYVDTLINYLQSIALPKYSATSKMINPPMIAIRFGNDTFIKGVVVGGVSLTKQLPILSDGKYARVQVTFTVYEVDPYDAETIINKGTLRGLSTTLEHSLYKTGD